ncbi:hypothetical protein N7523_010147 [Penicillium sp. IBT 18751x]|nr:hypothetical protein N7523_010147 [Penicillium sp. IBT 18751x]
MPGSLLPFITDSSFTVGKTPFFGETYGFAPFIIKGQIVEPKAHVKILGVVIDTRLKYKGHIARAASEGLAPVVDYASNVWMHAFKNTAMGPINRVQMAGAQAIVGTFLAVATSVAEAEAHIATMKHRFWRQAMKMWTDIHTLPVTNPLRRKTQTETGGVMRIAVSSSARNEMVGIGVAIEKQPPRYRKPRLKTFSVTLGARTEQKPILWGAGSNGTRTEHAPRAETVQGHAVHEQQSGDTHAEESSTTVGQEHICQIYKLIQTLRRHENRMDIRWVPTSENNQLLGLAKEQARAATQEDAIPQAQVARMKSTTLNIARSQAAAGKGLPENIGRHVKRVDAALPGKHTRQLYDRLSWKEASVLAQLRTGMARLNGYLYRINVAETDQCACGQAKETVDHFLFRCRKWTAHRTDMLQCTDTHRGNISFYLGGKPPSDNEKWAPDLEAVRASIRFAIATGRLEAT